MKKQIVFIHGGEAFSRYDAFLDYLKTVPVGNPLEEHPKRWKHTLREFLGEEYEVFLPSMPNSKNAKYGEWKIWFERHFTFLHDGVILIGHSQGGCFLAKYLSENTLPMSIQALFLIATPAEPVDLKREDSGDFNFDLSQFAKGVNHIKDIFIFHSKDDAVVPFEHALKYHAAIPSARLVSFEDKGHFLMEKFPELLEAIRGLDAQ